MENKTEQSIRQCLTRKGYLVIPRLERGHCGGSISVGMEHEGQTLCDVRVKKEAAFYRIEGVYKHGICRQRFEHYKAVQAEYGVHVWLFIYQLDRQLVLYAPIDYLVYPQFRPGKDSQFCTHGMAFFNAGDFYECEAYDFVDGAWEDTWLQSYQHDHPVQEIVPVMRTIQPAQRQMDLF